MVDFYIDCITVNYNETDSKRILHQKEQYEPKFAIIL